MCEANGVSLIARNSPMAMLSNWHNKPTKSIQKMLFRRSFLFYFLMDTQKDSVGATAANAEENTLLLPCWSIVFCAVVMASIAAVGIFLNTFLIFVTVQTKQFHGTANALLALNSLFEVFHAFGHFVFLHFVFSSDHCFSVSYRDSFRSSAFALFALFSSTFSMLFTAFDRFICVFCPLIYNRFSHFWRCFAFAFSLCAIPSFLLTIPFWQRSEEVPTMKVTGSIGDLIMNGGFAYTLYCDIKLACTSGTIAIYVLVAIWIWHDQIQFSMANRRIFFSLFVIVLLNVSAYFLIALFYFFWPLSMRSSTQFWLIRMILSIPANLSGASNAPILFMTSSDYRKAFQKQWQNISLFIGRIRRNSAIRPTTVFVLQQQKRAK